METAPSFPRLETNTPRKAQVLYRDKFSLIAVSFLALSGRGIAHSHSIRGSSCIDKLNILVLSDSIRVLGLSGPENDRKRHNMDALDSVESWEAFFRLTGSHGLSSFYEWIVALQAPFHCLNPREK